MAEKILLAKNGYVKESYIGFSWTAFIFTLMVPIARRDWSRILWFVPSVVTINIIDIKMRSDNFYYSDTASYLLVMVVAVVILIIAAAFYNKSYTEDFLNEGYLPVDHHSASLLESHYKKPISIYPSENEMPKDSEIKILPNEVALVKYETENLKWLKIVKMEFNWLAFFFPWAVVAAENFVGSLILLSIFDGIILFIIFSKISVYNLLSAIYLCIIFSVMVRIIFALIINPLIVKNSILNNKFATVGEIEETILKKYSLSSKKYLTKIITIVVVGFTTMIVINQLSILEDYDYYGDSHPIQKTFESKYINDNSLFYSVGGNTLYNGEYIESNRWTLQKGNIVDGKIDGVLKSYRVNTGSTKFSRKYFIGEIERETTYLAGKKNGIHREYNDSGVLIFETNYKNGIRDGVFKIFSDTGVLLVEGNLKDGNLYGTVKKYINGNVEGELNFIQGKMIDFKIFDSKGNSTNIDLRGNN